MMGRTRFLGRATVLGAATCATLLAASTVGVADAATATPNTTIPCTLSVTNPTYSSGSVQASATIRCAYPTDLYIEVDVSYNGNTPVGKGQSFHSVWVGSVTVTTSATPGYYQASAISVLSNGQQFGTIYSSNVYIPQ